MNNQTLYWVWLQQALGYGSNKITAVLDKYTLAEDFYRASIEEKLSCGCFNKTDVYKLSDLSLNNAVQIVKSCNKYGIQIVAIGDADYPERLINIQTPPAVLYVKGSVSLLSSKMAIAMVGTRSATPYGRKTAVNLAYNLAKTGVTVISGGAIGIDTYSHTGSLKAGGKTICVLGCGIEYDYLKKNEGLRNTIAHTGALVSEYPPLYPASRFTFPQRNRIISGLSNGVLVVEAGVRSGSLITANLALEQNRDVFAVPGDINSDVSYGTNKLIKAGAKPVVEVSDVLEEYFSEDGSLNDNAEIRKQPPQRSELTLFNYEKESETKKPVRENAKKRKHYFDFSAGFDPPLSEEELSLEEELPIMSGEDFAQLSENAQKILRLFTDEKIHIDSVTEKSGLSVGSVHSAITELEINDCIVSLEGRMYKLNVKIKG